MSQGKLDHAVDLFKKAIYINPGDILVYYHLGQAQERLGDAESAAAAYRTGLNQQPPAGQENTYKEQRQQLIEALKILSANQQ